MGQFQDLAALNVDDAQQPAAVQRRGEVERTVVLFTSDHGEMNGDHGLLYKSNFLRPAVQVPLILRMPAALGCGRADSLYHGLVESIDIGPTLVELAGGSIDYQQFGRSLRPALRDPFVRVRDEVLAELYEEVMLADGSWKVALNARGEVYLLFDLKADPHETRNLAGLRQVATVEAELRLRLLQRVYRTQVCLPRKRAAGAVAATRAG